MAELLGLFNYWIVIFLMMAGFYIVIAQGNLIKKVIGLGLFQASVFIIYISGAYVTGAAPPIHGFGESFSNPLPHVLILTAIVVSVSTMAVALALIIRIHEAYGSVEEDELQESDNREDDRDPDGAEQEVR